MVDAYMTAKRNNERYGFMQYPPHGRTRLASTRERGHSHRGSGHRRRP
jgi:hypothetical protein